MCHRVTCSTCGKPTYAGCGRHVEAVLSDVAPADRCRCREQSRHGARPEATGLRKRLASLFGARRPS